MTSVARTGRVLATIALTMLLAGGGFAPAVLAAGPDKAEVVLVLDFSASILDDAATRNRFATALEGIAERVDETQRELLAGDTTVTIVRFASRAADLEGCTDLPLFGSPSTVRKFADCLRAVAGAYRAGLQPALTQQIGNDTNYVAAMEQAAGHLPADAIRPTMILFSDGKHDVAGVPVSQVAPARDRLFGSRSPFALLPVGMGLDPAARAELEAGLAGLRTIRDMPACASGSTFEWPQVVFDSPDQAGTAVAVALQNATCTFTVAPTAPPTPSPTPEPTPPPSEPPAAPSAPGKPTVEALAGAVRIAVAPADGSNATGYHYECSADNGQTWPVEGDAPGATDTMAQVGGMTNGVNYVCRAFAANETGLSPASPLSDSVRPCSTFLECNALSGPLLGGIAAVLAGGILVALIFLLRGRGGGGYVVAVVDVVHSANIGKGSSFGIEFVRGPGGRGMEGIARARGTKPDVRVQKLRGDRFKVRDRETTHIVESGEPVVIVDGVGVHHELVLRAFKGKAASAVSVRR